MRAPHGAVYSGKVSTKIYDGFMFVADPPPGAGDILALLADCREQMLKVARAECVRWLSLQAVTNHDLVGAGLRKGVPVTLLDVYSEYRRRVRHIEATRERDPVVDWTFEVSVAPHGDAWLGIPFYEKEELYAVLRCQPWWADFGYWNNTDRPDDLTDGDWDHRESVWNAVIPTGVPSHTMFGYCFISYADTCWQPSMQEFMCNIPALSERLGVIERELCLKAWCEARSAPVDSRGGTTGVVGVLMDFAKAWELQSHEVIELRSRHRPLAEGVVERHPVVEYSRG